MSESVEVASSVEWQGSSVAADVGNTTHEALTAVDIDALADFHTPSTMETAGAETHSVRAQEDEAQLLHGKASADNVITDPSDEARLETKYATVTFPPSSSQPGADAEEDVIIAPLTVNALNQQRNQSKNASQGKRGQKRPRKNTAADDPADLAFRHSQKTLRKEASNLSLKEVLGRSMPLSLDTHGAGANTFPASPQNGSETPAQPGSFASPTTPLSSSSPSAWSPLMVGDITSRFLANVQQQRKHTVSRFIAKELSQQQQQQTAGCGQSRSQPALSPGSPLGVGGSASFPQSLPDILDDELVIGGEEEENLTWLPVTPTSEYSGRFARAIQAVDDASEKSHTLLTGTMADSQNSRTLSRFMEVVEETPAEQERRRRREEEQRRSEEKDAQALARKLEMWNLKQRHLRAQQLVAEDPRAAQKLAASGSHVAGRSTATGDTAQASSTTLAAGEQIRQSPGKDKPELFRSVVKLSVSASASQTGEADGNSSSQVLAGATSISMSNLSMEDISKIRRLNSYDNTASQSVMVFTTASSAGGVGGANGKKTA